MGQPATYTQGCGIIDKNSSGIDAAVQAAKQAEVVVVGVGISECGSWFGVPGPSACSNSELGSGAEFLEGETHDRRSLGLPPTQLQV